MGREMGARTEETWVAASAAMWAETLVATTAEWWEWKSGAASVLLSAAHSGEATAAAMGATAALLSVQK